MDPALPPAPPTTELSNLGSECLRYLERFLHDVLASSVAEDAFAQLIDGIPTRSSFEKCAGSKNRQGVGAPRAKRWRNRHLPKVPDTAPTHAATH